MIRTLLGELLEMHVADSLAQDRDPVLRELEKHDISGVKMNTDLLRAETVDKAVHLGRRGQITVEKDVLDIERDAALLGQRQELADRLAGTAVTNVDGNWIPLRDPGDVGRAGDGQKVLRSQLMSSFDH